MENNQNTLKAVILPIAGSVLLPHSELLAGPFGVSEALAKTLADQGNSELEVIALPMKSGDPKQPAAEDFHSLGVLFEVEQTEAESSGLILKGHSTDRVSVSSIYMENGLLCGMYAPAPDRDDLNDREQAEMLEYLMKVVREISGHFRGGEQYVKAVEGIRSVNELISYLVRYMPVSDEDKYELLKTDSLRERSLCFMDDLLKQKEGLEFSMELNEKISDSASRFYRKQILREQLKAIREELNESGDEESSDPEEKQDYRARISNAGMPEAAEKAALAEARKLDTMGQGNPEESVIRNYLDFMLALPWKKEAAKPVNLERARTILNERHYGLDKVKERIIQHLAVTQLKKNNKGSILLLVGPPGTGKTSLGKSIAEALDRKYIRISLGGIRDEAEIRGHRRTYVGALPGRILQNMKAAGTTNPVMVLDEVDKLMTGGFSGDPAGALLEVLDPEQNNTFTDHYLDLPYDLSDVFFIATANSLDTIPGPLLDRMEIIEISGYTADEKFHIGKEHLLAEVLNDHGLTAEQLSVDDEAVKEIIDNYTLEAGVRGLKKQFSAIARFASEKIVTGAEGTSFIIKKEDLGDILGRKVSRHDMAQQDNPPGVVTGLAWTPAGGEILFIEATDMPGSGEVTLTGQLGDVMKESAKISLSLLKSRLPLTTVNFRERDIHIHVPSGSVPKDGPSAGIALFTALASLFTGRRVDPLLAMTGEITLRGAVLPIGGLKEKLLGAQRAGIRKVLIPKENLADLKDVPEELRKEILIKPVETVEDVLNETIGIDLPRVDHVFLMDGGLSSHASFGATA